MCLVYTESAIERGRRLELELELELDERKYQLRKVLTPRLRGILDGYAVLVRVVRARGTTQSWELISLESDEKKSLTELRGRFTKEPKFRKIKNIRRFLFSLASLVTNARVHHAFASPARRAAVSTRRRVLRSPDSTHAATNAAASDASSFFSPPPAAAGARSAPSRLSNSAAPARSTTATPTHPTSFEAMTV
jgi:hypothetical protein